MLETRRWSRQRTGLRTLTLTLAKEQHHDCDYPRSTDAYAIASPTRVARRSYCPLRRAVNYSRESSSDLRWIRIANCFRGIARPRLPCHVTGHRRDIGWHKHGCWRTHGVHKLSLRQPYERSITPRVHRYHGGWLARQCPHLDPDGLDYHGVRGARHCCYSCRELYHRRCRISGIGGNMVAVQTQSMGHRHLRNRKHPVSRLSLRRQRPDPPHSYLCTVGTFRRVCRIGDHSFHRRWRTASSHRLSGTTHKCCGGCSRWSCHFRRNRRACRTCVYSSGSGTHSAAHARTGLGSQPCTGCQRSHSHSRRFIRRVTSDKEESVMTAEIALTTPTQRLSHYISHRPVIALLGVLTVLFIVTGMKDPALFTTQGIRSTLLLACPLAILAACQTVCMLTGGIDLSSTMIANFAAYIAANNSGAGPVVSLGFAFLVGAAVGAANGIGIGVFKVNPLIMTIGMSSVLVGIVTVGIVGDGFLSGSTALLPLVKTLGSATLFGPIPMSTIVLAALSLLIIFGLSRTGIGRLIYATGDNESAVRLAGTRSWRVLLVVYTIAGLLAALGGLMFSGISGSVGPDQTNSYLLPSVAAAIIGGTSILGGTGGFAGTIVGAFILTVLNRLLTGLETTDAVRQIIYGIIVLTLAWFYVRITGQRTD